MVYNPPMTEIEMNCFTLLGMAQPGSWAHEWLKLRATDDLEADIGELSIAEVHLYASRMALKLAPPPVTHL